MSVFAVEFLKGKGVLAVDDVNVDVVVLKVNQFCP